MSFRPLYLIVLSATLMLAACASSPFRTDTGTIVYLVRHAEKEPGRDPALTPDGRERANMLADILADADLAAVYSTQFRRTRDTAGPIASRLGFPILYYDPQYLDTFATQLQGLDGNALVVGHSNTTPELVTALGGEAGAPIVEANEYDRLYVLTFREGEVTTELRRYGSAAPQ